MTNVDFTHGLKCSRCSFIIVTSDGSLQHIEISQDPSSSINSAQTSHNGLTVKGLAHNVLCVDYHPELSLLADVALTSGGNFGTFYLYSTFSISQGLYMEILWSCLYYNFS